MIRKFLYLISIFFFLSVGLKGQLVNHYWVHAFNSTSSLLGGAVVAGEGDNSSIYYNPATISQMKNGSNFSLSANLFSWNFYSFKNAVGDGLTINTNNFQVQPQFFSYTYKPPIKNVSIAFAVLTRLKERLEFGYTNSIYDDVITGFPGDEKYNTIMNYRNDYTDTWLGAAFSHEVSSRFSYGVSLFVSAATFVYNYAYTATTFHVFNGIDEKDSLFSVVSEGSYSEALRFTDYRVIIKAGISYNINNLRLGLNLTTPTMHVFSSGKHATRIEKRTNIYDDGAFLHDYIIFDGKSDSELKAKFDMPWSLSFGFIYDLPVNEQKLYFTIEYFGRLKPYYMVNAPVNPSISSPEVVDKLENKDWLSSKYAARPVLNIAVAYSWSIGKDLLFMNAFRTDFSAVKNVDLSDGEGYNFVKTSNYDIYHYSGGVEFSIWKTKIIAGTDMAFGFIKGQKQMANFTDPVEFDPVNNRSLQGPLQNDMKTFYFGFGVFIGATLNFMSDKDKSK